MKKNIFAPEIRVVRFNSDDIIVTSPTTSFDPNQSTSEMGDIGAPGRYNSGIWD